LKDLTKFNISLMCKWWWKIESSDSPWNDFMSKKYLRGSGIFYSKSRPGDSPLWSDMQKIKSLYLSGRRMKVGDGRLTSFWHDAWCGKIPLKDSFPEIFHICNEQDITVAAAANLGWNFSFRRYLSPNLAIQVHGLLRIVRQISLSQTKDKPVWKWTKDGIFSVKSMYNHLCGNGIDRSFKHLWKSKIPLKIKIWLWLIWHNAIASKDNLLRRNWSGDASCQFCSQNESISHMFFTCVAAKYVWSTVAKAVGATDRPGSFTQFFWWFPNLVPASRNVQIAGLAAICWAIWKLRNRACFDKKLIKSPSELISLSVVFMQHWAGLHNATDEVNIKTGADNLLRLATAATTTSSSTGGRAGRGTLTIMDAVPDERGEEDMETDDAAGA
jgi:hypothetical protein